MSYIFGKMQTPSEIVNKQEDIEFEMAKKMGLDIKQNFI